MAALNENCRLCDRESEFWLCYECQFCVALWIMELVLILVCVPKVVAAIKGGG